MPDTLIGKKLGDYHIRELLGRGGMARVYLGFDEHLERRAAVKVINNDISPKDRAEYFRRFQNEARSIARLDHPNIVRVYQFGAFEDVYYMAMAFVEGNDLRHVLHNATAQFPPLPLAEVVTLVRQVGEALDYAHSRGVIHRDVKPSNIMVTIDKRAILTDFGLALSAGEGTLGETFGSAHYIAPEQAVSSANAVAQSDLYSLGVCAFEMLTGRVPFDDPSAMSVALMHLQEPPPTLHSINQNIPAAFEGVIARALQKDPTQRYQTGLEFADALARALEGGLARRVLNSGSSLRPPTRPPTGPIAPSPGSSAVFPPAELSASAQRAANGAAGTKRMTGTMGVVGASRPIARPVSAPMSAIPITEAQVSEAGDRRIPFGKLLTNTSLRTRVILASVVVGLALITLTGVIGLVRGRDVDLKPTVVSLVPSATDDQAAFIIRSATARAGTLQPADTTATIATTKTGSTATLLLSTVTNPSRTVQAQTTAQMLNATTSFTDSPNVGQTSTPALASQTATDAGLSNTPENTPLPGTPIALLTWDGNQLVLTNQASRSLSLRSLTFSAKTRSDRRQFEASLWLDAGSNTSDVLRPGQCYQLARFGLLLPTPIPPCGTIAAYWQANTIRQFWVNSDGRPDAMFEVFYDNQRIATCPIAIGRCQVALPNAS